MEGVIGVTEFYSSWMRTVYTILPNTVCSVNTPPLFRSCITPQDDDTVCWLTTSDDDPGSMTAAPQCKNRMLAARLLFVKV